MSGPRLLVAFRHGVYERNKRIDSTGNKAMDVANVQLDESYDYNAPLLDEGKNQARILSPQLKLAVGALDICITSPYRRSRQTAEIVFAGANTPIFPDNNLRERDLGKFKDIPREVFHNEYAESYARKVRDPLNWRPLEGETLLEATRRAFQVYNRRDIADKLVAFSSHADMMVAKRALYQLGALTTSAKLKLPLSPKLQNPQWIQNCQADIYTPEDPTTGKVHKDMAFFRSIATSGTTYDTGWLKIKR